ncbi:MAG TPA: DUF2971 domain-containing protein [Methylibium sp.]|nr:DUF2971 domain-containing protein [Methylibium sp.]
MSAALNPVEPFFISLARNYPPLFHYTRVGSLKALLESKALLARPIWDFADTAEYVHGIRLIRDHLVKARSLERRRMKIARLLQELYGRVRPNVLQVLDRTIDNLTYEFDHVDNPRVKTYVACFTQNPASERMWRQYGECIIHFNFMLPVLAYSAPSPFTSAMLSHVTYDEREFIDAIPEQGFRLEHPEAIPRQLEVLDSAGAAFRSELIANWVTERLCLFAPNIKRAEFAFEREWRLKSAISTYSADPALSRYPCQPVFPGLPETATFLGPGMSRYVHRLTLADKFISQEIAIVANDAQDLSAWVGGWQAKESMPQFGIDEFSRAYREAAGGEG